MMRDPIAMLLMGSILLGACQTAGEADEAYVSGQLADCAKRLWTPARTKAPNAPLIKAVLDNLDQILVDDAYDKKKPAMKLSDAIAQHLAKRPGAQLTFRLTKDELLLSLSHWSGDGDLDDGTGCYCCYQTGIAASIPVKNGVLNLKAKGTVGEVG